VGGKRQFRVQALYHVLGVDTDADAMQFRPRIFLGSTVTDIERLSRFANYGGCSDEYRREITA